jgi:hypothetical protein
MNEQTPPENNPGISSGGDSGSMTRRRAMAGGMSGLLLGALGAKSASAQGVPTGTAPQPLLQLGGVCEGTLMMLKPADAAAYMEKMLVKSPAFLALRDHFVKAEGMAFILSRAKVFMYVAPTLDATAVASPNIIGIVPSFKPVNRSDEFHEAAGIVVHHNGGAMATSVRVSHNPFLVTEFRSHELDPEDFSRINVTRIGAQELEKLSVEEAARVMGPPKIFERNVNPNSPTPSQADSTAMVAMALQMILRDSYARPLYPQEGLNSLLAQASLGAKLSSVHFQRYSATLRSGFYCSCTCCNGCTTTSFTLDISVR